MKILPVEGYVTDKSFKLLRQQKKYVDEKWNMLYMLTVVFSLIQEENGIVHGNIRCRKLLVSSHEENSFTVKLGDPGINHTYASTE